MCDLEKLLSEKDKLSKKEQFTKDIFDCINSYPVMSVQDMLDILCITNDDVYRNCKDKTIDQFTRLIVKNVTLMKMETIDSLRLNDSPQAKKLLLQLATRNDEYERISGQWTNPIDRMINDNTFTLPGVENGEAVEYSEEFIELLNELETNV